MSDYTYTTYCGESLFDFSVTWKIKDFYKLPSGICIRSSEFPGKNNSFWKFVAFVEKLDDNVSLVISPYCRFRSANAPETNAAEVPLYEPAECEISILNSRQNVVVTGRIAENFTLEPKHQVKFSRINLLNDFKNFEYELSIRCKIISPVSQTTAKIYQRPVVTVPLCNLNENLTTLLDDGMLSDVVITCQGQDFAAHKNVLACRSPVFKAMFLNEMVEKTQNRVIIDDISPEVLEALLRYVYSGNCNISSAVASDLMHAAEKYDLQRLKAMVANVLWENISPANACDIFSISKTYSFAELEEVSRNYIRFNVGKIVKTDSWALVEEELKHFEKEIWDE